MKKKTIIKKLKKFFNSANPIIVALIIIIIIMLFYTSYLMKANKVYKLSNYINQNASVIKSALISAKLNPIVIGDGNLVIRQYPYKDMTVLENSKVFLLTNSTNYIMPNMHNWTSNEAITFANLINLPYNINGYGRVTITSLNECYVIDLKRPLQINLGGYLNEEKNDNKEA